jgi:hypothetical protein
MSVLFLGCNELSEHPLREIQPMRSGNFSVAVWLRIHDIGWQKTRRKMHGRVQLDDKAATGRRMVGC